MHVFHLYIYLYLFIIYLIKIFLYLIILIKFYYLFILMYLIILIYLCMFKIINNFIIYCSIIFIYFYSFFSLFDSIWIFSTRLRPLRLPGPQIETPVFQGRFNTEVVCRVLRRLSLFSGLICEEESVMKTQRCLKTNGDGGGD